MHGRNTAAAGLLSRTNIAVVPDHGFLELKQQLQPNAAFRREGLITVDERGAVTDWQAWFHERGGSGFVYLKDPTDAALRDRVHGVLKVLQSDPANGLRKIFTRAELDAMGAHPDASFGLDVADGFYTLESACRPRRTGRCHWKSIGNRPSDNRVMARWRIGKWPIEDFIADPICDSR